MISGPSYEAFSYGVQARFNNQTVVDKVPPDMLHLIDAHWYQYPPLNPMWHGILGFVIGLLGFISVMGNGMVVYIFLSTKSLRTPSNLFVINLAISDFLMMFCMSPPMVCKIIFNSKLSKIISINRRNYNLIKKYEIKFNEIRCLIGNQLLL